MRDPGSEGDTLTVGGQTDRQTEASVPLFRYQCWAQSKQELERVPPVSCSTAHTALGVLCGFLLAKLLTAPAGLCVQVNADLCLVVINGEILVFFLLER